jgi:hypothetical protein
LREADGWSRRKADIVGLDCNVASGTASGRTPT